MSASNIIGNRNSTPEASSANLRLPSQRSSAMVPGHQLRASADEGRGVRPASEVLYNQIRQSHLSANPDDSVDKATQRWIADIDQYENTLEEMAAATLDQDFKDELSAIEQWFRVLSEPERTAALYALLDQSSLLQTRFFIAVLQQKAKTHPPAGVLSPANFGDKDAMSTRLSTAMSKLSVDSNRNSALGRPPPSPGNKRNSGLDQAEINNLFPDAVAAIATEKANLTQSTGAAPSSNRNSTATIDRSSFASPPTISAPGAEQKRESMTRAAPSSWGGHASNDNNQARPKSSSGQMPMGQFAQPLPSAGLRSPRGMNMNNDGDTQTTTLNFPPTDPSNMSALLSPYNGSGNWASMVNTPMVGNFPNQGSNQSNMVADATAARLAALSTVNNRIELGDVPRNSRRSRSNDGQPPRSPGFPPTGMASIGGLLRDHNGQILSPQQAASLQAQQLASLNGRSRPSSPSLQVPDNHHGMNFTSPQNNGFLAAYNGANTLGMPTLAPNNSGYYDGYHSDVDNNQRGRSPRGRRGTSKPPEDPTDVELLKDIPAWLRSLRLHKYTDNLKDLDWKDLIQLDDAGLDNRGVGALGARRKMLKVFEQVREAQSIGKI